MSGELRAKVYQSRTMDEIDAAAAAIDWMAVVATSRGLAGHPGSEITTERGLRTLWHKGMPIAIAVMLRDDANFTVLTTIEIESMPAREVAERGQ